MANKYYNYLNVAGESIIFSGYIHAFMIRDWLNCDPEDHVFPKYSHPRNEDKIKKVNE